MIEDNDTIHDKIVIWINASTIHIKIYKTWNENISIKRIIKIIHSKINDLLQFA
jgi:hypothetical protein